jgi:hypothetical protein
MTIKSGMFNSVNGDRKYKAEDFAAYFATFIANGVFPNPSTGFQVIANGDMSVTLKPGKAWINGYYITNDADYNLTIDVADGVLNRIDRIVLQLNYLNREIQPLVKKGTFASSPVAPALQRDADAYEIALADVYIGKGVLSISQANITDLRLNNEVCGIVHGTVDQVDTTTIFNQYQDWFNQTKSSTETELSRFEANQEQQFNDWFAAIQDILDGDVAGNLANRITSLEDTVNAHLVDNVKHITATERTTWNSKATPNDVRKSVEQTDYQIFKSNKDENDIFTTVEYKRPDGTLAIRSVLSGGTSPLYTTRTITYYGLDGTTVEKTTLRTLSYDDDGILISEV